MHVVRLVGLVFFLFGVPTLGWDSHAVRGVSWYGMETEVHHLEGLDVFDVETHMDRMSHFGFNTLRLPFAMEGVLSGVYENNGAYDTLHKVFQSAERYPMGIILDLHRLFFHTTSPLWHSSMAVHHVSNTEETVVLSETNVLRGWKDLLDRFSFYPSLLGIDLYNEPHGEASFHTGNKSTDFQLFIERAMQELNVSFFFATGIHWGQDMRSYSHLPESYRSRLVLSPHVYGPTVSTMEKDDWKTNPSILVYRWNTYFGYLDTMGWTVVIGEFGASQYSTEDMLWLSYFVDYLRQRNMGWIFWAWNPWSHDVQGFLQGDWKTPVPEKWRLLSSL